MCPSSQIDPHLRNRASFTIDSLEQEIKVDKNCQALLRHYHQYLLKNLTKSPVKAGSCARGADFFLRDFAIDRCRVNILDILPEHIDGFAGQWYITNTLEANARELQNLLEGIHLFYQFCFHHQLITQTSYDLIAERCSRIDFFVARIDSFNALTDDGYKTWLKLCPIPDIIDP